MFTLYTHTAGAGPDVVLVHGWGMHSGVWEDVAESLVDHYRVTVLDLPGHGYSRGGSEVGHTLDDWAKAVIAATPARAAWVGWSLGGLIAQQVALTDPARVRQLALVNSTPCFIQRPDWPQGIARSVLQRFAEELREDYRVVLKRFIALEVHGSDKASAQLRQLKAMLFQHGEPEVAALEDGLAILETSDLRASLAKIACPTLLLMGQRDQLVPAKTGEAMLQQLPDARLRVFPGLDTRHSSRTCRNLLLNYGRFSMHDDREGLLFAPDRNQLRRAFERAAADYDEAAFLHREVGGRLLERLDLIKLQPQLILDVGCGTGVITLALMKKYRRARVIGLERAPAMLAKACKRKPWFRTLYGLTGEPEALPLANASCDLIFSNLALPWVTELDQALAEFRRVLKPGGALLFSTLGPDTLVELRRSWVAASDGYNHVNAFFDMHDIGDALLRARLAEPVMDVERLTLTYSEMDGLARDLKALGARNVTRGRPTGLMSRKRWQAVREAYEQHRRSDGLLPVSCEVVYGHAWGPTLSASRPWDQGPAVFPLSQLRRRNS